MTIMTNERVIALDFMSKETVDAYASIESSLFGDILLEALGIEGGCTLFRKSAKYPDCYIIGWWIDGDEHKEIFSYDKIMTYLKRKKLTIITSVEC